MGDAMKMEEYIPTTTPSVMARANPLIIPPPNILSATRTISVVLEVRRVLEIV